MISATLRAAYLHGRSRPKKAPFRFWLAFKAIWFHLFKPAMSLHSQERLAACLRCHIYDSVRQTCGDGTKKLSNGEFVGCLCYMPFKVTIPTATCWLHDQGVLSEGWKPEPKDGELKITLTGPHPPPEPYSKLPIRGCCMKEDQL